MALSDDRESFDVADHTEHVTFQKTTRKAASGFDLPMIVHDRLAFSPEEYVRRYDTIQKDMDARGLDALLLRTQEKPATFLPKCVEAQLQHNSAGDLYGFFGASLTGDSERYKLIESEKIGDFHAVKKIKRLENAPGEWNHYRIEVKGDTVKAFINGELANEGSGIDVVAGPIGLQTEGSEIHFKNVRLEPLPD